MSLLAFLPACKSATGRLQQPCPAKNALDCEGTEPARDGGGGGGGDGGKPVRDGRATGGDDSGTDSGVSGTGGTGGTGGSGASCDANDDCDSATPICNTTTQACGACTSDKQCKDMGPLCDEASGQCVACVADTDCTDGTKPQCTGNVCVDCTSDAACTGRTGTERCDKANGSSTTGACVECVGHGDCENPTPQCASNTCVKCTADAACAGRTDATVCDVSSDATYGGTCVECTVNDETACTGNVCSPATRICSGRVLASKSTCEECIADSECEANHRCVPMEFMGATRPTGYCLQPSGGCVEPYGATPVNRPSLSGAAAEAYCSIDESRTTCEAMHALLSGTTCTTSGDCTATGLADARCELVNGLATKRCTYSCNGSLTCPSFALCKAGYCGGP